MSAMGGAGAPRGPLPDGPGRGEGPAGAHPALRMSAFLLFLANMGLLGESMGAVLVLGIPEAMLPGALSLAVCLLCAGIYIGVPDEA